MKQQGSDPPTRGDESFQRTNNNPRTDAAIIPTRQGVCRSTVCSAHRPRPVYLQDALTEPATDEGIISSGRRPGLLLGRHELEETMLPTTMNNRWPGAGLGFALGCLLFVAALRCEAQGNLVPNHSFEERDTCLEVNMAYPLGTGPLGWFSAGGTGDYFLSCLPYGAFNGVPLSSWAFQYPQDGENFVGVATYSQSNGYREYFMVELTEPLVQEQTYYASFYANATWGGTEPNPQLWLASSHVGMLFTMEPRPWQSGQQLPAPGNVAHVYHPWIISDTVDWTLVSGSFVADSAYQYLMIGNHFDNTITDTLHFGNYPWNPAAHTLIDNVCVSPNPNGCPLALEVPEPVLSGVVLFPNPAVGEVYMSGLSPGTWVAIHDAFGRLLWAGNAVARTWRMDVSMWARGAYVLRVEQGGKQRSLKFMLAE